MFNPADSLSKALKNYFRQQLDHSGLSGSSNSRRAGAGLAAKPGAVQTLPASDNSTDSVQSSRVHNPLALLGKKIQQGLNSVLPAKQAKTMATDYGQFMNPRESIRQSVADVVNAGARGGSSVPDLYSRFQDSIETSIAQTKELLEKIGQLNNSLENEINAVANDLVDDIKNGLTSSGKPAKADSNEMSVSGTSYYEETRTRDAAGEVSIRTKEGDTVTLSFHRSSSYSNSEQTISGADYQVHEKSSSIEIQGGFSVTVEGDLNEQEKKAIGKLLGKVRKLAENFYDGEVGKALQQAEKLKFDPDTLSSLSVDLSLKASSQKIAAYQNVAQLPGNSSADPLLTQGMEDAARPKPYDLSKAIGLIKELKELINNEELDDRFEQVSELIYNLFEQFSNEFMPVQDLLATKPGNEPVQAQGLDQFRSLIDALIKPGNIPQSDDGGLTTI